MEVLLKMRPAVEGVLDKKHMGFSTLGAASGMDRTHQVTLTLTRTLTLALMAPRRAWTARTR